MGISSRSREIVRLEHSGRVSELGRESRTEIERLKQTMPRGGGLQKAVDDLHVRLMSASLDSLTDAYISAYAAEDKGLTLQDVEQIVTEMNAAVQSQWQSRAELEPRSIGLDFHDNLKQIVPRQRQKLVLAMRRAERDRELATRPESSGGQAQDLRGEETPKAPEDVSGVTVDDVDAFELKPNVFGIGINLNHLIKRFATWRKMPAKKKS